MDSDDLRALARRDWAALASAKQQYWAGRFHGEGGAPARHAATLLQMLEDALGQSDLLVAFEQRQSRARR